SFQRRQDLRNTWTKPLSLSNNTSVVFLTGRSKSESVHAQVVIEANKTKDLIVMNFDESYKNLSVKTLLMLRWVKDHCPNAKFILKADDDMFINIYNLLNFINGEQPNNSAIYGKFAHNWPPIRNSDSKWMVTLKEYDKPTYPDFVTGPSYLVGTKDIGQLLAICVRLPYLFLEDVFVTGICAEKSKIPRKHHSGFINMSLPKGRCSILQIISVHRIYGRTSIVFFTGLSNNESINSQVIFEANKTKDLIVVNFDESYRNLSVKTILMLRWVKDHCPNAKFILKADDDIFINIYNLLDFINSKVSDNSAIYGHLGHKWPVIRNNDSKWKVTIGEYNKPLYPDFVTGPSYLFGTKHIRQLLAVCVRLPYLFLEDVFVTGVCAEKSGIPRIRLSGFVNRPLPEGSCSILQIISRSNNESVNSQVTVEANKTKDLIIVNFDESYRNLSVKTLLMLRWVKDHCPNAKFILKADDDMFINIYNLLNFINGEQPNNSAIYGKFAHNWPPIRNSDSKWMVTLKEYDKPTYPDFVTGPSYLVGTKDIGQLLAICVRLPYLFLEDVFVTGICAEKSKTPRKHHSGFVNMPLPKGRCSILQIISVHEVDGKQDLRNTWTKPLSLSNNTSVVFLTGRSKSESVHAQVVIKANKTKDLIVMNFDESYKNLSVKTLLMLRWVKDHCPNAKFILKADDDMFINIYNLLDFINREESNNSAIYGKLGHNWAPIRNSNSKWMVTLDEYDKPVYPDYITGPSYLFGTKDIGQLLAVCVRLPYLCLCDRNMCRKKNTWTKPLSLSNNTSVVFLTGRSKSESVHAQVIIEANKTKDLIVMNFDESYKNLSVKTLLMLRWVKDHCPNAKFLLKADDDMFINIYNLLDFINSEQPNNSAIYGKFAHNWPPIRNSDSKWMVTLQEYDKPTYPDFVAGPSYLFGTKHIGQLLAVCIRLPYLYLEDVFVTGICAEESRIARKHHSGFVNMPLPTGRCSILQIISVHRVYGRSMKNLSDLRNTWSKPLSLSDNTSVVFLTGQSKENLVNDEVFFEANGTRDMVIVDFDESYRNLSLKTLLMLRWVKDYCSNAEFILKVDDDVFINVYNLMEFINREEFNNSAIYGNLGHKWPPIRNNDSKWMATMEEYDKPFYPDFVTGPAYLVGTKIIAQLLSVCVKLPYLFLEDVFVTGICAEKRKIPRLHHSGFSNMPLPIDRCKPLQMISFHTVLGLVLQNLWESLSDSSLYKFCKIEKPHYYYSI
uniref:Galectin domain-containing protein n=1 Tax=Strigamia maritima TaxID=126957 RepID=T1IKI1_STRMM